MITIYATTPALLSLCALSLVITAGCAEQDRAEPANPGSAFSQMENSLLAAQEIRFNYHITSEGVFEADLRGRVVISAGDRADLVGNGTFGSDSVRVVLRSDGTSLEFGRNGESLELITPAFLNESLVVGITRMGLLHNLARLVAAAPPDRAEGGVREWVEVGAFSVDSAGVAFDIAVGGKPAGAAKLAISEDGLPQVRHQLISFPEGQMRVTERYSNMSVR